MVRVHGPGPGFRSSQINLPIILLKQPSRNVLLKDAMQNVLQKVFYNTVEHMYHRVG